MQGRGRWLVDTGPLRRSRDLRLLLGSLGSSSLGSSVTMIAAPLQVARLTGSPWLTGLLASVEFLPSVVCGLWGGAVADAHDRRRVVMVCEAVLLVLSGLLLANALLPTPHTWPVFVVAAGVAAAAALQRPSSDALLPRLVPYDDLAPAAALDSLVGNGAALVGPALGGLLAATSLPAAYGVDIASFLVSLALLSRLSPVPPSAAAPRPGVAAVAEGLRYAISRRDLLGSYAVDLAAMAFAVPDALFPFLADDLHAPRALGLLYVAVAAGAALAAAVSGWTARVHRYGRAIVLAALAWGAAMALAGAVSSLPWVLACLALAGAADMVSGVFRMTLWNASIPDELRGRLAGIELLSYTSGPTLGGARAGAVAGLTSVRTAIWSGGVLCVLAVAGLAAALPTFLAYDVRTDPHAAAVRARAALPLSPPE